MRLTDQCEAMLSNRLQCPNSVLAGQKFCAIHTAMGAKEDVAQPIPQIVDGVTGAVETNPDRLKKVVDNA